MSLKTYSVIGHLKPTIYSSIIPENIKPYAEHQKETPLNQI